MKKHSVLLAILALVLASLACQTVMGGGDNILKRHRFPNSPKQTEGMESRFPPFHLSQPMTMTMTVSLLAANPNSL